MKIVRVEAFRAGLRQAFWHASAKLSSLDQVFVKVTAENEMVGWGEVRANMPYLSGESGDSVVAALRDWLVPEVVGMSLAERGRVLRHFDATVNGNAAAKAVVDLALSDLAARVAEVPLFRWWGGRHAEVSAAQCLFYGSVAGAAEQARRYVEQGFGILKVRVGMEPFTLDVDRVSAVRDAAGPAVRLAVDANQAWSVKEAIRRIRTLERYGLDCVEQPVTARDARGLAEVARAVDVPIMADESLLFRGDAMDLIRLNAIGMVHVKLNKGGVRYARQLIALVEAANIPYIIGGMQEGMLATVAGAHCALSCRPKYAELYGADGIENDPTKCSVHERGRVVVPEGAGLGIAPDESALALAFSRAA